MGADPITRVRWQSFRVALRSPFVSAHESLGYREGLIVRVESASGAAGLGEASPLAAFAGGTLDDTAVAVGALGQAALEHDPAGAFALDAPVAGIDPGSLAAARCGMETALADRAAGRRGMSVAAWLAEVSGLPAPVFPLSIPVNATIAAADAPTAALAAGRAVAAGFRTLKLKVGMDVEADLERLAAVRGVVGPGVALRVDANGGWSFEQASAFLSRCAPLGVSLCEQPLAPNGEQGWLALARLRRATPIALGIDEGCRSIGDLQRVLELGAADVVVIKPMATGLREALRMIGLARQRGTPAIVTTMFDSGVGTAIAAQLAATLPPSRPACGLATLDHLQDDLVIEAPRIEAGMLHLATAPGLGVTLDAGALTRQATHLRGEVSI